MEPETREGDSYRTGGETLNTFWVLCKGNQLTSLQKSNLVILAEHTKAWDALRKLNNVLHGVCQPDGTVLPHLIH